MQGFYFTYSLRTKNYNNMNWLYCLVLLYCFIFQNGNWADRWCDEKHGFICMKQSETERTGDEVDLDIGCKAVSEESP